MASEIQDTPFVKQLAANDRPTREKALTSLRTYLTSGRDFTATDLLKIWKGLFFCIFHTDRPLPQQRLTHTLSALLLALPVALFIPFLRAFWTTLLSYWDSIPSLRLDKYLYLVRQYIAHNFTYLAQNSWKDSLVEDYLKLVEEMPLSAGDGKVPDGVRYHVLDVWVDGLVGVEGWEERKGVVMRPVEGLMREGRTKVVRERAAEVLSDDRFESAEFEDEDEGEWEGLEE